MPAHKPFNETIVALRFGTLHDDLTTALNELTRVCSERGKAGTLTLTIGLKPGKAGQMEVFDDVRLKLPKDEKGSSIMFVTPDGNLVRTDPRHQEIEGLRSVDKASGEIRQVLKA